MVELDSAAAPQTVDNFLTYVEAGVGMYKLFNQLLEAEALLAAGDDVEAHKVIANVRSINPQMVREFEESGFRYLGLDRSARSLSTAHKETEPGASTTAM